ncbi:MAG TPA: ribosome maturation factor RimP [Gemmatimonadales bacterium]|jgi:ribosome maturation factor RimP
MTTLDPLTALIQDTAFHLGFELVDVRVSGPRHRLTVRVRIDRPDSRPGSGVTSDDCTRVARALRAAFQRAGRDPETLEVSSPGLERPLRFPQHWRRFAGERVRLRSRLLPGRPTAVIVDVPDDEHVTLRLAEGGEHTLPLAEITEATLVVDWTKV